MLYPDQTNIYFAGDHRAYRDDATKYRPLYYPEYAITVPATATPTIILQMKALGADPGAVAMMPSTSAKMDRTTIASICSVL